MADLQLGLALRILGVSSCLVPVELLLHIVRVPLQLLGLAVDVPNIAEQPEVAVLFRSHDRHQGIHSGRACHRRAAVGCHDSAQDFISVQDFTGLQIRGRSLS